MGRFAAAAGSLLTLGFDAQPVSRGGTVLSTTAQPRAAHRAAASSRPSPAARVLGVLGELLITLGVIAGLFLLWQLWWTDVLAERDQQAVVSEVRESFDPAPAPAPVEEAAGPPAPSPEEPPTIAAPAETEVFGVVHVPRWGADYEVPIAEGVDVHTVFNRGNIGHYPGTAMPGAVGNFATAAHRQSYGAPYGRIEELQAGDVVVVETAEGWFVYRVTEHYVVTPDQVGVVAPVPNEPGAEPTERLITLTTCHPLYSSAQRWITHGVLAEWYPRAGGAPTHLLEVS